MHVTRPSSLLAAAGMAATLVATTPGAGPPKSRPQASPAAVSAETAKPPSPRPASRSVDPALRWLVAHQLPSGAWGQGEESQAMGAGSDLRDVGNVADTGMAALALVRAGSMPSGGPHSAAVRRAVDFVCSEVEKSPAQGLEITSLAGTRVQAKLGRYIDTFVAGVLLGEVVGNMGDAAAERRVLAALGKVTEKIQANQREDGGFTSDGWAPALAQGMAASAMNKAAQAGLKVDEVKRERAEKFAGAQYDAEGGGFSKDGGAGIELYGAASSIQAMTESDKTNRKVKDALKARAAAPSTPPSEKREAEQRIASIERNERSLSSAQDAVVSKMSDPSFVAGFGSNGGEEFLSYLSLGESLRERGGREWTTWRANMVQNMERVQNQDGSWTGHHCITGRTFCTSAALMVLTLDRAKGPLAAKIRG